MSTQTADHPGRRQVLAGLAATGLAATAGRALAVGFSRVRPGEPGWPSAQDWSALGRAVGGRLAPVVQPVLDPADASRLLSNPFYLRDQPGLTQSSGWVDAWRSAPSAFVVRAKDAADVSAAVRFAARQRLRLVVKGGGHSYLGGSNAPDSLLIWTRDMEAITVHDAFTPQGSTAAPIPAVSVGAGCIWLQVYQAVTTQAGRYVQGGGCTTVGVAGLVQGGGFGSFSKRFGLAAAGLIEAEIVLADGSVRIVNASQEPDLFWALKGGGGGTFGVVTRLTLATHDLPATFGVAEWTVQARSDEAFRRLLARFVDQYADHLFNAHWGEQARAAWRNRLQIQMMFQGLDQTAAQAAWADFIAFVAAHPEDYATQAPMRIAALPARRLWDPAFLRAYAPSAITVDQRPGAQPDSYWWAGDGEQVGTFWHGYQSAWLPARLLAADQRAALAEAWFLASRHWSVSFHFNKGLAGAPADVIAAARDTAMNPQVADAFALAIIAMDGPGAFPGQPAPDLADARDDAAAIAQSMAALKTAAPDAGCYMSECDFGLKRWREACWGEHAARLTRIKQRYDPQGLFFVHHGVGSEGWSADGFTRTA